MLADWPHTSDERYKLRRRLITRALFAGCKSGRTLRSTIGQNLCDQIIWDESSPEIGSHSAASFPADLGHMVTVIERETPGLILGFGRTACEALEIIGREMVIPPWIAGPHPAARHREVMDELREMRAQIQAASPLEIEV